MCHTGIKSKIEWFRWVWKKRKYYIQPMRKLYFSYSCIVLVVWKLNVIVRSVIQIYHLECVCGITSPMRWRIARSVRWGAWRSRVWCWWPCYCCWNFRCGRFRPALPYRWWQDLFENCEWQSAPKRSQLARGWCWRAADSALPSPLFQTAHP